MSSSGAAPKTCFVIAPIGAEGSPERARSDRVLNHVIRPAVQAFGYRAVREDKEPVPGVIMTSIIQKLIEAPLVVADLTGRNANVFYELSVRHALGKPVIQLLQKGEVIPFDVAGLRTIHLDHTDLEDVARVIAEIGDQIASIEKGMDEIWDNPIHAAFQVLRLRHSGNPADSAMAQLLQGVSELKELMTTLQSQIVTTVAATSFKVVRELGGLAQPGAPNVTQEEFESRRTAEMHLHVADILLADNKLWPAQEYYERVLKRFPDDQLALIGKGKTLKRRANTEGNTELLFRAIEVLNDCIEKHPTYERAYYNRACYRCLVGEPKEVVLSDLGVAIELFPGYCEVAFADPDFRTIRSDAGFLRVVGLTAMTRGTKTSRKRTSQKSVKARRRTR